MTIDKDRHPTNPEYWAWRTAVFERDNGLCQICGGKGHEVHHILGWTRDPDRRYDVKNGITLCIRCHEKTDNYYRPGFKRRRTKKRSNTNTVAKAYRHAATVNPVIANSPIATSGGHGFNVARAQPEEGKGKPFFKRRGVLLSTGLLSMVLSALLSVGALAYYHPPENMKWLVVGVGLCLSILGLWLIAKSDG